MSDREHMLTEAAEKWFCKTYGNLDSLISWEFDGECAMDHFVAGYTSRDEEVAKREALWRELVNQLSRNEVSLARIIADGGGGPLVLSLDSTRGRELLAALGIE